VISEETIKKYRDAYESEPLLINYQINNIACNYLIGLAKKNKLPSFSSKEMDLISILVKVSNFQDTEKDREERSKAIKFAYEYFMSRLGSIAEEYFPNNKEQHLVLVNKLIYLKAQNSTVCLDKDNYKVTEDSKNLKDVKGNFVSAKKHAEKLKKFFDDIGDMNCETSFEAIRYFDIFSSGISQDFLWQLDSLIDLFDKILSLEGSTSSKRKADWKIESVEMCKEFWRRYSNKELRISYNDTDETSPQIGFTEWYSKIMILVLSLTANEAYNLLKSNKSRE